MTFKSVVAKPFILCLFVSFLADALTIFAFLNHRITIFNAIYYSAVPIAIAAIVLYNLRFFWVNKVKTWTTYVGRLTACTVGAVVGTYMRYFVLFTAYYVYLWVIVMFE